MAIIRKNSFKKPLLVFRGRKAHDSDQSVVIFVSGYSPEDSRFIPRQINGVAIQIIFQHLRFCGADIETTLQGTIKQVVKENRFKYEGSYDPPKRIGPGSAIIHVYHDGLCGTLGLILRSKNPGDNGYYGLTCAHVVDPLLPLPGYSRAKSCGKSHPPGEETLIINPVKYNPVPVWEYLEEYPQWLELSPKEQNDALDLVSSEIARESVSFHVGSRVSTQREFFRRQDGSMGIMDLGIIKLDKDRIDPECPNKPIHKGHYWRPPPPSSFTFGTFKDVTRMTRFEVYGFMSLRYGGGDSGVIHDTEPIHFFLNLDGKIEEVTLRGIMSRTTGMDGLCAYGDSGAIVFDADSRQILGMVIGKIECLAVIMTVDDILERIGSDYVIA